MKRLVSRHAIVWLAALVVWAALLGRAMEVFAPSTDVNDVGFNSDAAIPVLMSNETRPLGAYRLYYYAADRWGAWPFLMTRWVGEHTGYHWTDDSLFRVQAVWVFLGALVFATLNRDGRIVAGLCYLVVLCIHRDARYLLFELSQVYGWQCTGVLLGWACLRRLHSVSAETTTRPSISHILGWLFATFVCAFLAIWSSVASTLLLLFLLHLEAVRLWLQRQTARGWTPLLVPYLGGGAAIVLAAWLEQQQKQAYRTYAVTHWGNEFATYFSVDYGYLRDNLLQQWQHLSKLLWWPLYVVPLVALLGLLGVYIYASVTRDVRLREALADALASETAVLAAGCAGIAAINLALAIVVSHVRLNGYDSRYLTLTHQFAPLSGLLTLLLTARLITRGSRASGYVPVAAGVLAAVLLVVLFPTSRESVEYGLQRETAITLARKAPHAVLLGGYWETYVFSALQPQDPSTPVPFEGQLNRTPWTGEAVHRAREVIVGYPRPTPDAVVAMPPRLEQYGCRQRLREPHWLDNALYAFGLYTNDCE